MSKLTKRQKLFTSVDRLKSYTVIEALDLVKSAATAKFDESIDISINLGVDPRKSDQMIRGSLVLPHGTGKTLRVAVFAQGDKLVDARNTGADIVGLEDLAEDIKRGNINFDIVIATPDTMKIVGTLGQILGPRGLMPNPKVGTVTTDVVTAIKNAKAGQIQYRTDKNGIIHATVGRASFSQDKLIGNVSALINELVKLKPSSSKGQYIKKVSLSSTMGIGVKVDHTTITS